MKVDLSHNKIKIAVFIVECVSSMEIKEEAVERPRSAMCAEQQLMREMGLSEREWFSRGNEQNAVAHTKLTLQGRKHIFTSTVNGVRTKRADSARCRF